MKNRGAAFCGACVLCAAATPAAAQSSVTLYGIADAYLGATEASGSGRAIGLSSAGIQQSRIGIRVTEDLGAGLVANAVLENGFALNNGAAADPTRAFSRQAWLGLSGGFGEVRAGRQNSPQYVMLAQLDAFTGATYGSIATVVIFLIWLSWNVNAIFFGGALATEVEIAIDAYAALPIIEDLRGAEPMASPPGS